MRGATIPKSIPPGLGIFRGGVGGDHKAHRSVLLAGPGCSPSLTWPVLGGISGRDPAWMENADANPDSFWVLHDFQKCLQEVSSRKGRIVQGGKRTLCGRGQGCEGQGRPCSPPHGASGKALTVHTSARCVEGRRSLGLYLLSHGRLYNL